MKSNQQAIPLVILSFEILAQITELINVYVFQMERDLNVKNR